MAQKASAEEIGAHLRALLHQHLLWTKECTQCGWVDLEEAKGCERCLSHKARIGEEEKLNTRKWDMIERLRVALEIYGDKYVDIDYADDEPGIEFRLTGGYITIFIEESCGKLSFWTCDDVSKELQAAMDRVTEEQLQADMDSASGEATK